MTSHAQPPSQSNQLVEPSISREIITTQSKNSLLQTSSPSSSILISWFPKKKKNLQMARLRSGFSSVPAVFQVLIFFSVLLEERKSGTVGAAEVNEVSGNGDNGQSQFCGNDLSSFLPPPYGNLSNMQCHPIWNTFVLRYSQREDHVITFVLSALYTSGWVGIGFSKDGKMLNASAMVGWITTTGHARIKQYHLRGYTPSQVHPGKGELNLTTIPPVVVLNGANIYLAFQLRFISTVKQQPSLFAYGSKYPALNTHVLSKHDDQMSMMIDYSQGEIHDATGSGNEKMKRSHGILGLIGWGLILPVGAMIARFLRHREPLWYYLHTIIQFVGFLIILAGVVVGQQLYSHVQHVNVAAHRGIGYFAFTLSILQVLAFFVRPNKESKIRGLWNGYHRWLGVVTLLFGSVNIMLGFHVGGVGLDWKIGYGFLVGTLIATAIVLQIFSGIRSQEKPAPMTDFQMN